VTHTFQQDRGARATFTAPIFTNLLFVKKKKLLALPRPTFVQIGGNVERTKKMSLTQFGKLNTPLQRF